MSAEETIKEIDKLLPEIKQYDWKNKDRLIELLTKCRERYKAILDNSN